VDAIVLCGARGEKDDGNYAERGVETESATEIQTVSARHHNIQKEQGGRLSLCIPKYLVDSEIRADSKTCAFKVVLDQARDIRIVFQHKNRLTQFVDLGRTRIMINVRLAQSG
jgi:hypothetical protein